MNKYKLFLFSVALYSFHIELLSSVIDELIYDKKNLKIEIFATDIDSPRQLAQGDDGRVYVGSRRSGKIFALTDSDRNGIADSKELVAENLTFATGVSLYEGDLYFSEIDKIWKIEKIGSQLDSNLEDLPDKILVSDDLPDDEWHGWKWLQHDHIGNLYTNVGAPCNVCLSDDKRHATILKFSNNAWSIIARGVRNSVGLIFIRFRKNYFLQIMVETGLEMTPHPAS